MGCSAKWVLVLLFLLVTAVPADAPISCQFGGNAAKASDGGTIKITDFSAIDWQNFRGSEALTGHITVNWELTLKPGETKEVTCEYHYFLR